MFDWLVATLQAKPDFKSKSNAQNGMTFSMDIMNMLLNKFCKFQANRMKIRSMYLIFMVLSIIAKMIIDFSFLDGSSNP